MPRRLPLLRLTIALAALALLAFAAPGAAQPDGAVLRVNGENVEQATTVSHAIPLDVSRDATVEFLFAAWPGHDVTASRVVVAVALGAAEVEVGALDAPATLTTGEPGHLRTTVPLDRIRHLGTGVFWVHASVFDASGQELWSEQFLVKIEGAPFVTVEGVVVWVASLALAYGLWRLLKDLLSLFGMTLEMSDRRRNGGGSDGTGFRHAYKATKRRLAVRWTFASLGGGVVAVSWAHLLGWVPLDSEPLLSALENAATVLAVGVIAYAAVMAIARKPRQPALQAQPGPAAAPDGRGAEGMAQASRPEPAVTVAAIAADPKPRATAADNGS